MTPMDAPRQAMDHKPRSDLRQLLRTGLSKSLVSLVIKVATAGLTYGMYVILSRSMGLAEYGYFAFGLSLATILSIGANYGQQTAILRYWPEAMVVGRPQEALVAAPVRRRHHDHCGACCHAGADPCCDGRCRGSAVGPCCTFMLQRR